MTKKTTFFEGLSWFKFTNLGLALGTALNVYTSATKIVSGPKRRFFWEIPLKWLLPTYCALPCCKIWGKNLLNRSCDYTFLISGNDWAKKENFLKPSLHFSCAYCMPYYAGKFQKYYYSRSCDIRLCDF